MKSCQNLPFLTKKKGRDDRYMKGKDPTSRGNILLDTDEEDNNDPTQEVSSYHYYLFGDDLQKHDVISGSKF